MRVYAIGDVHGYLDELKRVHALIEKDLEETGDSYATVVHLGDLNDRGPDTRGVIDFLIAGREAGKDWIVIKGNHDRLFEGYMRDGALTDGRLRSSLNWLSPVMGARETLASYGVEKHWFESADALHERALAAVPEDHVAFLRSLPLWHLEGELLFVHAGILPGVPLEAQAEDDLLWIRDAFLWDLTPHPWLVVHGHTPVDEATHYGNRVNLDTGAGFGRPLTAAVFEGRDAWVLTDEGRQPLLPP